MAIQLRTADFVAAIRAGLESDSQSNGVLFARKVAFELGRVWLQRRFFGQRFFWVSRRIKNQFEFTKGYEPLDMSDEYCLIDPDDRAMASLCSECASMFQAVDYIKANLAAMEAKWETKFRPE